MNVEEYREYCISKKGVTESFPFDEVTLVFKVRVSNKLVIELIDHSYDLVVSKFTKKLRAELNAL